MSVKLVWATPDGDDLIAYCARVSNPANQDNKETAPRLIKYLLEHKHFSPFEMVNACVEITTTRDVSRQILRHRSFTFQEFSGRYAAYSSLQRERELRLSDKRNRQSSLPPTLPDHDRLVEWFSAQVEGLGDACWSVYKEAIDRGVAKEVARALLPEGLVPTTMYMNGTLRSWIHYWSVRCTPDTQKEHRVIAELSRSAILPRFPMVAGGIGHGLQSGFDGSVAI